MELHLTRLAVAMQMSAGYILIVDFDALTLTVSDSDDQRVLAMDELDAAVGLLGLRVDWARGWFDVDDVGDGPLYGYHLTERQGNAI